MCYLQVNDINLKGILFTCGNTMQVIDSYMENSCDIFVWCECNIVVEETCTLTGGEW